MVGVLLVCLVTHFSSSESVVANIVSSPPSPSIVLEGQNITFVWSYTLDSNSIALSKFANVTGGGSGVIIAQHSGGSTSVLSNFRARFRASISVTRAEITLHGVRISDQGGYEYDLTSDNGGAFRSDVQLIVNSPPKFTNRTPDQTVNEGTNLQLFCEASGKPAPDITWIRLFEDGSNSGVLHRAPNWNFPNINGSNAGTYRCTADNGAGSPVSHTVRVFVRFSPRITLVGKYYVGKGANAYLHCRVEAYPPPIVSWVPCNLQQNVCDSSLLNILNVQTPRANYTCTATNERGQDSKTTTLVIGGKDIYISVTIITNEKCTDGSSWRKEIVDEMDKVFANRNGYSSAKVLNCRHGSVIVDLGLTFSVPVAEDFVISTIQSAIQDGKLGELSVNASSIVGIPSVIRTTASPTSKTTAVTSPDQVCHECSCNCTSLIALVGTLVAIIIALIMYVVWLRRKDAGIIKSLRKYQDAVDENAKNNTAVEMLDFEPHLTEARQQTFESLSQSQYMALNEASRSHDSQENPPKNIPQVSQYAPLHPSRSWEIPRENVTIEKVIGKGAFGQIAKGTAVGLRGRSPKTQVAVKMLKADAPESDRRDLLSELEVMKTLKPHPHVIKLLGCVTESELLLVLIEYVPYGDLLGYLRKSRGLNDTYYKDPDVKPQTSLTSQQLMKYAWQIADGMNYLSSRSIIHRDLAARNVLVGEGERCKVTDFGMARDVQQENIYEKKTKGRLPVKWTAYEALLYGTYTTKSDVWSYGVLLYEIFTIGGSPYPRMDGRKIAGLLQQGYRMPKPKHVNDELYKIMTMCWQEDPNVRPTFEDLRNKLKQVENQHKRLIDMNMYDTQLYANVEDLGV